MKKFFIALCSLAILLVSCGNLTNGRKNNEEGLLTLSFGTARMAEPDVIWNVASVNSWEVTFKSTNVTVTKTFDDGNFSVSLPLGTYDIEVTGTRNSNDYTLYGYVNNVELTADGKNVTVFVGLKKEGKGNEFTYTLPIYETAFVGEDENATWAGKTVEVAKDASSVTICDHEISAYLTPMEAGSNLYDVHLTVTCETTELDDTIDSIDVVFSGKEITSGYYYLIAKYNTDAAAVISISPDNWVEIADDFDTVYAASAVESFEKPKVKTIYVAKDTEDNVNKNGVLTNNPKGLNAALTWLKDYDNADKWDSAVLNFVGNETPVVNFEMNPTTENDGKTVTLVWNNAESVIKFENGKVYLTTYNYSALAFEATTADYAATLETTSSAEKMLSINSISLGTNIKTLTINNVYAASGVSTKVTPAAYTAYSSDSCAFLVINYSNKNRYDVSVADTGYTVIEKTSDGTVSYYTADAGKAENTISKSVPDFTIYGEVELSLDGTSSSTYKCVTDTSNPENTVLGTEGYSYEWMLNGYSVGEDSTYTLDPVKNEYVKLGTNILMVIVTGSGDYSVSKSVNITVSKEKVGAVYDGSTLSAVKMNHLNSATQVAKNFTDFATDNDENLYVAELGKISRYKDISKISSKEDVYSESDSSHDIKLFYDTVNDSLYFGYYDDSESVFYIKVYKYSKVSKITDFTAEAAAPEEVFNFSTAITVSGSSFNLESFDDFVVYNDVLYFISLSDAYDYQIIWTATDNIVAGDDHIALFGSNVQQIEDCFSITDIALVNNTIYALVAERNIGLDSDSDSTFYSRGALVPVNTEQKDFVYDSDGNRVMYGYYNDNTALDISESESADDDYSAFEGTYFFGPSKFLAVSPNKLYIADDGAYFCSDEDGNGAVGNVDRVVTFDYTAYLSSGGSQFEEVYFRTNLKLETR